MNLLKGSQKTKDIQTDAMPLDAILDTTCHAESPHLKEHLFFWFLSVLSIELYASKQFISVASLKQNQYNSLVFPS